MAPAFGVGRVVSSLLIGVGPHDPLTLGVVALLLAGVAAVAVEDGRYTWAAPLLSAADNQLESFGGAWWPADRVEIERIRSQLDASLGDSLAELREKGRRMRSEEAIEYAQRG